MRNSAHDWMHVSLLTFPKATPFFREEFSFCHFLGSNAVVHYALLQNCIQASRRIKRAVWRKNQGNAQKPLSMITIGNILALTTAKNQALFRRSIN